MSAHPLSGSIDGVYYVQADSKVGILNPLAIRPEFLMDKHVTWGDSVRAQNFQAKKITYILFQRPALNSFPKKIIIKTEDGDITLTYITAEIFQKMKQSIGNLGKNYDLKRTKEIQEALLGI